MTKVRKKNKFKGFLNHFRHRGKYKKVDWKKAEILIVKLIENNISEQESEWLTQWLQDEEHLDYFNSFVEINYLIQSKSTFDPHASLKQVKRRVKPKTRRLFPFLLKYAAAIVILLGSAYFLFFNNAIPNEDTPIVIANTITTGTNKATLTLEDGSEVVLNKGTSYQTAYVESDGEALVYQNETEKQTEIVYNILTIPRGGQFFVQLSDGTKVWLNSESQLKYPKNFIEGNPRHVELVYGEAYFEVSPSTAHNGSAFNVASRNQIIEVLGTQFNVKAYQDEQATYTTLVEGKIALETNDQKKILKPNDQAVVVGNKGAITIKVVEVFNEISWKDGVFSFKGKSLVDIMKVLSRWYDVEVVFENKALETMTFRGVLGKDQSIEDILSAIQMSSIINAFEINGKIVTIK